MNSTEAQTAPNTRQSNNPVALVARLSDERAADIVEALNDLAPDVAAAVPCRVICPGGAEVVRRMASHEPQRIP